MLSIFSCFCGHLYLEKGLFRSSTNFSLGLFFDIELHELFVYFGDYPLSVCKYFLPFEGCPFILFMVSFTVQKLLRLIASICLFLFLIFIILGGESKKILLQFISKNVLHMCSSKNFIVSSLIFRSSIHLVLTFVYGIRKYSDFFYM